MAWCRAYASATKWSAETRVFTATLLVFYTQNSLTGSQNLELLRLFAALSQLKWIRRWCPSRRTDRDELHHDVQLHQILRWPTPPMPWLRPPLQNWEPVWMDGDDQPKRQNKLLWETCRRVLQIGHWRWPGWPNLCPRHKFLTPLYFISHHLPACSMLHIFVLVGTHTFPHLLYPEALQRNNYTECDECH